MTEIPFVIELLGHSCVLTKSGSICIHGSANDAGRLEWENGLSLNMFWAPEYRLCITLNSLERRQHSKSSSDLCKHSSSVF